MQTDQIAWHRNEKVKQYYKFYLWKTYLSHKWNPIVHKKKYKKTTNYIKYKKTAELSENWTN